jgi:hypothetical protein
MKCISIRQPWVAQILAGTKVQEYRSRPCRIRGRVLIHASRKVEVGGQDLPTGCIVGAVEIVDCQPDGEGGFAWALRNPVRFAVPVPFVGQVGWFEVPDDLVADQLASAGPC